MKIAIIGYGKMGKQIEQIALQRNYEIIAIIDNEKDWKDKTQDLKKAEVAIEFTQPSIAPSNILKCFELNLPIVCGTTGWNEKQQQIIETCIQKKQALFTASNFSIGVNIFSEVNRVLAKIMKNFPEYNLRIEETHHTQKLDSPSGTAVSLAQDIIKYNSKKNKWENFLSNDPSSISIISKREGNVTGEHYIFYESENDIIEISHKAFNRIGFTIGAVEAAKFLVGKKGHFTMTDLLNF